MNKPLFSVVAIVKNEEKTLPGLLASLKEFKEQGGEVVILDTGSTDGTMDIASAWGCKVESVGSTYLHTIDKKMADDINSHFIVDGEEPVLVEGDKYFDFASARNYAASLASNDHVSFADADEAFTKLDIKNINELINQGFDQFEYNFVFAHDQYGKEAIKFIQSKFYNRKKINWVGIVHEVLSGEGKRVLLNESLFKLEHWQNQESSRHSYLVGLAVDCFLHPEKDRNSHYFARELLWSNRPKSALKEFSRHITMGGWLQEKAQSMIFMGDCYGRINDPEKQVASYARAFHTDFTRRESLIRLARFYQHNNKPMAAAAYAAAALQIPYHGFYANVMSNYTYEPHEILYWAYGWMGRIPDAQEHIKKALEFQPLNSTYLRDLRYYFKLPKVSIIIPTLGREAELQRCIEAIHKHANYPDFELIIKKDNFPPNNTGVPKLLKEGVAEAKGELIMYLGNDCVPQPDFLILAVWRMMREFPELDGMIGLNDGYWHGNDVCTHFLISKKLL